MNHTYRVILEPDQGGYHAFVPALPGCHTWGKTIDEARKMVRDAMGAYIRSLVADGEPVPQDTGMELFETIPAITGRRIAHAQITLGQGAHALIRVLKKLGFTEHVERGTSHLVFSHPDGRRTVVSRHGAKDIPKGTLGAILRDLKIPPEELRKLL